MLRKILICFLVLLGSTLTSALAHAHPHLKAATPAPGSIMRGSPPELRLTFSEAVLPRFSGVQVTDQRGRVIPTKPRLAPNRTQLIFAIPGRLPAGVYRVTWRTVSADTHRVTGRYTFRVRA